MTATRPFKGEHHPAMVNAEPRLSKPPSATPTFCGLPLALLRCGVPAANPMAKSGLIAAVLWSLLNRKARCLILRHGSVIVIPAAIGLRATHHTWHYEQWLHLKFAGRQRRRDLSPAGRRSCCTPTSERPASCMGFRESCCWPLALALFFQPVPAAQNSCFDSCDWRVLLLVVILG